VARSNLKLNNEIASVFYENLAILGRMLSYDKINLDLSHYAPLSLQDASQSAIAPALKKKYPSFGS